MQRPYLKTGSSCPIKSSDTYLECPHRVWHIIIKGYTYMYQYEYLRYMADAFNQRDISMLFNFSTISVTMLDTEYYIYLCKKKPDSYVCIITLV